MHIIPILNCHLGGCYLFQRGILFSKTFRETRLWNDLQSLALFCDKRPRQQHNFIATHLLEPSLGNKAADQNRKLVLGKNVSCYKRVSSFVWLVRSQRSARELLSNSAILGNVHKFHCVWWIKRETFIWKYGCQNLGCLSCWQWCSHQADTG